MCSTFILTGAIAVQSGPDPFRENSLPTLLASINCTGTERSLLQCDSTITNEGFTCGSHRDAGVVCQGNTCPKYECQVLLNTAVLCNL